MYVSDIHLSNKFLYRLLPSKLSLFRLTTFSLSFYVDKRLHSTVFYGTRVLIHQFLSKRFIANKIKHYASFSSRMKIGQVVGATTLISGKKAMDAVHLFLQYSLIRISYGLLFIGPLEMYELNRYSLKTGFNRVLFLFPLSIDSKYLSFVYDQSFYGFDICFRFDTENIYINKVILSHLGYPLL